MAQNTSGYLIHNHISPSIPRHASNPSFLSIDEYAADPHAQSTWVRDFPALWITNQARNEGKAITIRMIVHPLSTGAFPQSHKIILTSPHFDLFFHWTYDCNPFTFRSLVKDMKWDIAHDEVLCSKTFDSFGETMRERVMECISMPSRFAPFFGNHH